MFNNPFSYPTNQFGFYDRYIAQKIGINSAIVFAELLQKAQSLRPSEFLNHELYGNYWFPCSLQELRELTTFNRRKQDNAILKLIEFGFLESKQLGLPASRFFRFPKMLKGDRNVFS